MSKLKIETQPRDDHQVRLVAEFEPEQLEKSRHQAARKISQSTRIAGFRPGKAPYEVVRRMVGEKTVTDRALELMVEELYPQVIKEAGIHPYTSGTLDEIVKLDPPTLAFVVPLEPDVELGDYRAVRLPYEPPAVTDKDVDEAVEGMQQGYATIEPVDRPAAEGDLVAIKFHGHLTHPVEDEEVDVFPEGPNQVWIRPEAEQAKEEWPYPGFGREMLGVKAGDEKSVVHVFAEDAEDEKLRGREVEFHVKVENVKAMILPALDEEFVSKLGNFKTADDLRADLRKRLELRKADEYNNDYYTHLTDTIRETSTITYPPQALENETEEVLDSIKEDLSRQNLDFESYLKIRQMDQNAFIEKEIKPAAEKRLERSLIVNAIGKAEQIKLDVDEVTNMVTSTLSAMQSSGSLKRYRGRLSNDEFTNALAMDAAAQTMNHQVLERLKAIATGAAEATVEEGQPEGAAAEGESTPALEAEAAPVAETAPAEAGAVSQETVSPEETAVQETGETPSKEESPE